MRTARRERGTCSGIATTVQCVAPTVEYAVRRIRTEILPRFPNVDGVVAITHGYGCGVAIDAPGAAVPIHTLRPHQPARQHRRASRWWSAWDARSCSRRGCFRERLAGARAANVSGCRTSAGSGDRRGDHARRREAPGGAEPAAADARARLRSWSWGCNAAAATRSPA